MPIITDPVQLFTYSGNYLHLAGQDFLGKVKAIYRVSTNKQNYVGFKPESLYPPFTALEPGVGYIFVSTETGYVVPDSSTDASPMGPQYTTYSGALPSKTPTAQDVKSLFPAQRTAQLCTVMFSCAYTYPIYAEPQEAGIRILIRDQNGFDVSDDVVRTALVLDNVPYWVYTFQNPQVDPSFLLTLYPQAL